VTITELKTLAERHGWHLKYERGNVYLFRKDARQFEVTCGASGLKAGSKIISDPTYIVSFFHNGKFNQSRATMREEILKVVTS